MQHVGINVTNCGEYMKQYTDVRNKCTVTRWCCSTW